MLGEAPSTTAEVTGRRSAVAVHEIEKGEIRRFAAAIGDVNPLHHDEDFAVARGFRSLIAPPTFAFTLRPGSDVRADLGLDWRNVLHGEQRFRYRQPITAGDRVVVQAVLADLYEKRGGSGAMTFIVVDTTGHLERGAVLYEARSVTIVRRRY